MRDYPAEWPLTDGLDDTLPTIYLHLVDTAWPPAQPDLGIPVGWGEVIGWDIEAELDAPLMPGQVNADAKFVTAVANCTIAQPEGGLLAPWRAGSERTPKSGHAEIVASHDGPLGATAMVLGKFLLDPIKGKLSDASITLRLIQDTVRARRDHTLPPDLGGFVPTFSPTRLLEIGAASCGFILDATADFDATITSSYFPRRTDQITAMQSIVAANLGAMFPSMDGTALRVLDPDYLLGTGDVIETLQIDDDLDDLSWSQDPNAAVDRIEVTYLPPIYDDSPFGSAPNDAAPIWTAPKGARLAAGASVTYTYDPGTYIWPRAFGGSTEIFCTSGKDGTGSWEYIPARIDMTSSGSWTIKITNTESGTRYLMAPHDPTGGSVPNFPKNTRAPLLGTIDGATESAGLQTISWGATPDLATNTLSFNLGRNIQTRADALVILDRIITRITTPTYVIEDVRVPLDFRWELGDLFRLEKLDAGFNVRAMVTGVKFAGTKDEISQTASFAILPLLIRDFNEAWDAAFPGGATIADFNAAWAGKTVADLNDNPLKTAP